MTIQNKAMTIQNKAMTTQNKAMTTQNKGINNNYNPGLSYKNYFADYIEENQTRILRIKRIYAETGYKNLCESAESAFFRVRFLAFYQ
jgi:hypothetical protein